MKALEENEGKTHWTVRRLRRRARTSSLKTANKQTAKESKDCDEKDEDTTVTVPREDSHRYTMTKKEKTSTYCKNIL